MLAARLGAWLRHTGERWAKAAFAEKLAVLLALGAVLYTIVTGAAELRYQARAREALAQVKAARLAASAVSAQCYSAGQTFADQTSADGFADGIAEEIRTLGSLPGTVTLLQIDPNGYTVQRLLYQENGMYAIYDADGGYRVFRAEDRLQYGAFGGGDIKLMAAAGLFLGWQNTLLAMFFGIVFGGIYGIYLLAAKKAGKKDHFAFGPFLCAGIVIAMLFGGPVLEWYCAFL